jgi:uncharacterized protein with FMN-binding domain
LGVITLGILAGSFQAGLATSGAKQNLAEALNASGQTAANGSSSDVTPGSSSNTAPTGAESSTQGSTASSSGASSESTSPSTPQQTPTAAPKPSATAPATPEKPATNNGSTGTKSATGDAIYYRYGTIQIEVVKTGSTISAINLVQASTKGRQYESVPPMLVSAALNAQGTAFGNVSGATFTSEAFRSALDSALGKL